MDTNVMSKRKSAMKYGAGAVAGLASTFALAAPDGAAIATQIAATDTVVDSAGGAMIAVFVGIMIFSVIIGMIARKGK